MCTPVPYLPVPWIVAVLLEYGEVKDPVAQAWLAKGHE